jgi:hypothetical protein
VRTDVTQDLLGVVIRGVDATRVVARWAEVLGRDVRPPGDGGGIALDHGFIDGEAHAGAARAARVDSVVLRVHDAAAVLDAARGQGWEVLGHAFRAAGVWFDLRPVDTGMQREEG